MRTKKEPQKADISPGTNNLGGRPTKFTKELAARICLAIVTSSRGIRKICEENEGFPSPETIYRWIFNDEEFRQQYARAKEAQCQVLADEIIDIADTPKLGSVTTVTGVKSNSKKKVKPRIEEQRISDMTRHRQLQVDARKWTLSKLMPRVYGDKLEVLSPDDPVKDLVQEFRNQREEIRKKRIAREGGEAAGAKA